MTFIFALQAGEYILSPIALGIVIGLMLGPVALRLERHGLPSGLSAFIVVALFIGILIVFALIIAAPLTDLERPDPANLGAIARRSSRN